MSELRQLPPRISQERLERLGPIHDRLLVRVEAEKNEYHGLVIPEVARRAGAMGGDKFLRIGVVVKAGPGDAWPPMHGFCARCGDSWFWPKMDDRGDDAVIGQICPKCRFNFVTQLEYQPGRRRPMGVGVGDRILFDYPSDKTITVEGDEAGYVFLHEEQHVLAVLEEDAAWDAPGYRNGQPDYEAGSQV